LRDTANDFTWIDGERLIRFGEQDEASILNVLESRGFTPFVALTGRHSHLPPVTAKAATVLVVEPGPVPEAAAALRDRVGGHPIVAIGGGRVIDSAKAIAGADDLRCAAIPSTLSGAEMTRFHRMPAGVDRFRLVRPELVVAIPSLMASAPMPLLAASAMNALAHAVEALYTPLANPVSDLAALDAAERIRDGLAADPPDQVDLALGSLLAGYASGVAGFAIHHAVCQTIVRVARTPHAQTNALMLPHFVRLMAPRAPNAIERLAVALGAGVKAEGAHDRIAQLASLAQASGLAQLGVTSDSLDAIVADAMEHPAMGNTPSPPDSEELLHVLQSAL
jgi:alcohol dehydrogenase class IV